MGRSCFTRITVSKGVLVETWGPCTQGMNSERNRKIPGWGLFPVIKQEASSHRSIYKWKTTAFTVVATNNFWFYIRWGSKDVQKSTELVLDVMIQMPAEADYRERWSLPTLHDFPSEPSEIYCFRRKCTLDFSVHVGACAVRPQTQKWLGRGGGLTTDCTHWKPQTPFPDLSISPTLSVLSRNSPYGATIGVTDYSLSIHLPDHFTLY